MDILKVMPREGPGVVRVIRKESSNRIKGVELGTPAGWSKPCQVDQCWWCWALRLLDDC